MKKEEMVEEFKRKSQDSSWNTNSHWRLKNPEKYEAAKALYEEDKYSLRMIGEHFGVSYEGLRRNFVSDGVKMRTSKRKRK